MPSNAIQKCISLDRESTFQAGIADHDSPSGNGGLLYMTEEDFTNVRLAMMENANYKKRPAAKHAMLPQLKSASEGSFSVYMYGASTNALAAAQAARLLRDEVLLGALAGETRGYAADITGGSASAPETTTGQLATQATYSWGWFYDDSADLGRFRKFSTVTVGATDTINMLTGHNLPFTPANGDTMFATVGHFPYWDAMEDHANALHYTHTIFRKGRKADDSVEALGVKFEIGQLVITAGERPSLAHPFKSANFTDTELITQPDLDGTPQGVPSKTVGSGTGTTCEIANVGSNLATERFWGSITIEFGITYSAVDGPNGEEGVHGWGVEEGSYEAQTVEIMVPYDDAWHTHYRAAMTALNDGGAPTNKHMLVQVGNTPTNTWGVYFPNLAWREEPQHAEHNGRKALILRFDCLEDAAIDTSALTEPAVSRAKAKFEILRTG
jgi:hypothetical protein